MTVYSSTILKCPTLESENTVRKQQYIKWNNEKKTEFIEHMSVNETDSVIKIFQNFFIISYIYNIKKIFIWATKIWQIGRFSIKIANQSISTG
jgi:hypothetical protein